MNFFEKLIFSLMFVCALSLIYGLAEAKELKNVLWAKCILNEKIKPCKLVNTDVYINGKLMNVKKLHVTKIKNTTYVLLESK